VFVTKYAMDILHMPLYYNTISPWSMISRHFWPIHLNVRTRTYAVQVYMYVRARRADDMCTSQFALLTCGPQCMHRQTKLTYDSYHVMT
jgi:hypothetical protein